MAMTGLELIILFKQDKAFLTPDRPFTLAQAGVPDFVKSFTEPAFWTVRVLKFIEAEKRLHCEIVSYQAGNTDFPAHQIALAGEFSAVATISYRSIDTPALLRTMNATRPISIRPLKETPEYRPAVQPQHSTKKTFSQPFSVPLKNVRFKNGCVRFDVKFDGYPKPIELTITNDIIREEFDAVKNYFANVLQTKKIQVRATVEMEFNEVITATAHSPEIEKINPQLIDEVRLEVVKASKKKAAADSDRSLYTMEEYFDTFGEEGVKSSLFYTNEKELLEDLLTITDTKHYKHLRFLSSKHCHQVMKLRFIHKPFSFLFLIEGKQHYHLVWETLDTEEATYVWHIDKNAGALKIALQKTEDIIGRMKAQGKNAYVYSTEDAFQRIYHDYSATADGFLKWKAEIESVLA